MVVTIAQLLTVHSLIGGAAVLRLAPHRQPRRAVSPQARDADYLWFI